MKYAIDRIEDNIKEKKEISIDNLPKNITEGSIILFKDNQYVKDINEEATRRENIMNKFNRLKK